jgi:cytochrome c oxidase cbb3-type subunit III
MAVEERDPHTGYLTTGHEWNGIIELNRPVPRVIWIFLGSTVLISIILWILMPAWPLVFTYTKGILGLDQRASVARDIAAGEAQRSAWTRQIETLDYAAIQAEEPLMNTVRATGRTLFEDNCAACHGTQAQGGGGYPRLSDDTWLWGGSAAAVAETIRVGINAPRNDTRVSEMLAFGRGGILQREAVLNVADYVRSLSGAEPAGGERAASVAAGKPVFAENCASCHGESGKGMIEMGAPDLTDDFWIYGGDRQSVYTTVYRGRQGHMPAWEGRLSALDQKILTLYVLDLGQAKR